MTAVTDEQMHQQLSAALRAQASNLGSGLPHAAQPQQAHGQAAHGRADQPQPDRFRPGWEPDPAARPGAWTAREAASRVRMPVWSLLALAVVLGALAGAVAGVVSAW